VGLDVDGDEVNAAGFGLVVTVLNNTVTGSNRTASVDAMALTVTYSLHPAQARIAG
jgi:hypothetical protein